MGSDDIVTELERWADDMRHHDADMLLRARDQIVALRERLREQNAISVTLENAHAATRISRDEALEEAEIACLTEARDYVISLGQDNYRDGCRNCAAAIRALKEKGA